MDGTTIKFAGSERMVLAWADKRRFAVKNQTQGCVSVTTFRFPAPSV